MQENLSKSINCHDVKKNEHTVLNADLQISVEDNVKNENKNVEHDDINVKNDDSCFDYNENNLDYDCANEDDRDMCVYNTYNEDKNLDDDGYKIEKGNAKDNRRLP